MHVEALDATSEGTWVVTTQGSRHFWYIHGDVVKYRRVPGTGRSQFPFDDNEVRLLDVERWPAVGFTSVVWFVGEDELVHWRQSSTITSICTLDEYESDAAHADGDVEKSTQ